MIVGDGTIDHRAWAVVTVMKVIFFEYQAELTGTEGDCGAGDAAAARDAGVSWLGGYESRNERRDPSYGEEPRGKKPPIELQQPPQ